MEFIKSIHQLCLAILKNLNEKEEAILGNSVYLHF